VRRFQIPNFWMLFPGSLLWQSDLVSVRGAPIINTRQLGNLAIRAGRFTYDAAERPNAER
jgi:hypothetical protein